MNNKEYSPFTPGSPVPVELFVGRIEQIEKVIGYVDQTSHGKQENVFLSGERGIGKSSLASFLRSIVSTRKNMLGLHVFLGGVSTLEEMVGHIFEQLLKEAKGQTWFSKISQFFGSYIQELGLFGVSVSFAPSKKELNGLVRNFPEALDNLLKKIREEKRGLFIALDDINGLAEKEEFANWYKSFVDKVATQFPNFPVFVILIGLPEKRVLLSQLQPSLMRIFRVVEIEKLSDGEVKYFLSSAFEKVKIKVENDAIDLMVKYSSGLPILMHEIGDAIFWIDEDGIIDNNDALTGIIEAAENIGRKYLDTKVYNAIRSENYKSILRKLATMPLSRYFTKRDVESKLNEKEKKVFHNFLRRIRELGIIESDLEKGKGSYRFVNEIYPVYIWMEAERSKRSKKIYQKL